MKLTLAENIRAFRKERRLTQDQLAEALGVTVGSVYKWESGQSIPELNMLVEIADFFDTSMDALLGYRMKDNDIAAVIQRMREYCRVRNPEALDEAEKVLKKEDAIDYIREFREYQSEINGTGGLDRFTEI